jgi:hypothetical protein
MWEGGHMLQVDVNCMQCQKSHTGTNSKVIGEHGKGEQLIKVPLCTLPRPQTFAIRAAAQCSHWNSPARHSHGQSCIRAYFTVYESRARSWLVVS